MQGISTNWSVVLSECQEEACIAALACKSCIAMSAKVLSHRKVLVIHH